jgi:hypothetical protein
MKMNIKNIKMKGLIASLFLGLAFLFSCEKQEVGNPLDGVGSSYLRLDVLSTINNVIGWNVGVTAMDASPHTQTAFIIHRDAISNGDLNKTVTVDFALDPAYLASYNPAAQHVYDTAYVNDSTRVYKKVYNDSLHFINDAGHPVPITPANYDSLNANNPDRYPISGYTAYEAHVVDVATTTAGTKGTAYALSTAPIQYEVLPANTYSFVGDGLSGNTLTFAPGETTKELKIKIDPATLSFTTNYALTLTLSNPNGIKLSEDNPAGAVGQAAVELINQIIVKNKYDGIYSLSISQQGWAAYGIADDTEFHDYDGGATLTTTGASGVSLSTSYAGALLPGFSYDGTTTPPTYGQTGFGATAPAFAFDSNNNLTSFVNTAPPDARNRTFSLDPSAPSGYNVYDPASGTIKIAFLFHQNSRPDEHVQMILKYKGPR